MRRALLLILLATFAGTAQAVTSVAEVVRQSPVPRSVYTRRIDGVSGSTASLRLRAHDLLLMEGFSVLEIAACDCLVLSDTKRLTDVASVQLRVHILKLSGIPRASVVLEAVVAPIGVLEGAIVGPPPPIPTAVAALLQRTGAALARASIGRSTDSASSTKTRSQVETPKNPDSIAGNIR